MGSKQGAQAPSYGNMSGPWHGNGQLPNTLENRTPPPSVQGYPTPAPAAPAAGSYDSWAAYTQGGNALPDDYNTSPTPQGYSGASSLAPAPTPAPAQSDMLGSQPASPQLPWGGGGMPPPPSRPQGPGGKTPKQLRPPAYPSNNGGINGGGYYDQKGPEDGAYRFRSGGDYMAPYGRGGYFNQGGQAPQYGLGSYGQPRAPQTPAPTEPTAPTEEAPGWGLDNPFLPAGGAPAPTPWFGFTGYPSGRSVFM